MSVQVPIPETAPVMVLPDCNFFPHTPLPLYIFEPRYRAMLALALESERMICIATVMETDATGMPKDVDAGVYLHGTIGLVRACLTDDDGTSNLLLEGLRRVVFDGWIRDKPFRIAELQPLDTIIRDANKVKEDAVRLTALTTALMERGAVVHPILREKLGTGLEAEILSDMIANFMLPDIHDRHALLAMEDLSDRMKFLIDRLKGQLGALGPPG